MRYKNFLSSGNIFTEINLNTHKNTLIMGPNGSGKSTILDALTFSLFGKPFRKVNKGNVINSINQKNCVTEIEFSVSGKNYKIIRGVKPNIFEIWLNGIMLNQDASSKDYQDHLEKNILRMNYKTFTQVVILGSSSFVPFMQLTPADRRSVIENLLDIQVFSAMSNIVKTKLQLNKDLLERNRITLTSKEENRSYVETTLRTLRANNDEKLSELIDTANDLNAQRQKLSADLDTKNREIDRLLVDTTTNNILRKKHTTLVSLRSKMEGNRQRTLKENFFYRDNQVCPTCKQEIGDEFKFKAHSENDKKIMEIDDGLNKIEKQIDECLLEISNIENILQKINKLKIAATSDSTSIANIDSQLRQIETQIASFSTSDKALQDSERQLETITTEISELQEQKKILLDDRQYIDLGATLLKDGGIKTKIIKQYLPIINKHINKYLSKMGFFVNFNINESFEESIKSRYRDEFSYNNFSEGEKLRIDLAILLTWRQIAKLKNSVNVNIIVFDEILDRAMDSSGIDEFLSLMWAMGDEGANVFVISHRDTMNDKFQRTLKFSKVKNFSVIENDT